MNIASPPYRRYPPRPRLRRQLPKRFCRHPHPARAFMRDTRTLLPAAPTPSAPAALLPRPQEGAGSVRGDTWWEAVSGVEPAGNRIRLFSGISPCTGPWGYRHGGWGRRGGGTRSPSPVSNAPEIPHISPAPPMPSAAGYPYTSAGTPHPARAFMRDTRTLLPAAPTPPAPPALLPRPTSNRERVLPPSPLPGTVRAPFSAYGSRISLPR